MYEQSTAQNTKVVLAASYVTDAVFAAPYLRPRTLVIAAKKLMPFTTMNVFLSNQLMNVWFTPCTMVQVPTNAPTFLGNETNQLNEHLYERTTSINSYDTIIRGEVITCAGGSAVVVADETIYDKVSATNKRILYVTNVKGTLSGTITGSVSLSSTTVTAVTAGTSTSNSLGNLYGALVVGMIKSKDVITFSWLGADRTITTFFPDPSSLAGDKKVLVTSALTNNPAEADTFADALFSSNGVVNEHTTHNDYESTTTTTITNTRVYEYS